jgi:hypothetical protein
MREAVLYDKLPDSRVKCRTCQWRCRINPGKYGVCGMYQNREGTLFNLNYNRVSFTFIQVRCVFLWVRWAATSTASIARTGKYPWLTVIP